MVPTEPGWPALDYAAWQDTCATLHLWTQIVGKVRLALAPPVNHWWHVPLYLTARGLTTSPIPYGDRSFQVDFDFIDHRLRIELSDGRQDGFALAPRAVAEFYDEFMGRLRALGIDVRIWTMPVEVADPIPFEQDREHAAYDPDAVNRFWRALALARPGVHRIPRPVSRQGEPGAFLLGQLRSRGHPIFRPARAAAAEQSADPGRGQPRGLFARGQQLRLLARQWRLRPGRLLLLRLPAAARLRRRRR